MRGFGGVGGVQAVFGERGKGEASPLKRAAHGSTRGWGRSWAHGWGRGWAPASCCGRRAWRSRPLSAAGRSLSGSTAPRCPAPAACPHSVLPKPSLRRHSGQPINTLHPASRPIAEEGGAAGLARAQSSAGTLANHCKASGRQPITMLHPTRQPITGRHYHLGPGQ